MQSYFFVRLGGKLIRIDIRDIRYIISSGHHIEIFTDKETIKPHLSLKQLEPYLPFAHFCRVNRSTLVALGRIEWFDREQVFIHERSFGLSDKYGKLLRSKLTVLLHEEAKCRQQVTSVPSTQ